VKLTRRGEIVLVIGLATIALIALLGIYKVAISVHYTGTGYCLGSFDKCYGKEEGK
jgi:hypothetical protein